MRKKYIIKMNTFLVHCRIAKKHKYIQKLYEGDDTI